MRKNRGLLSPNGHDRLITRRAVIAAAGLSSGVLLLRPSPLLAAAAAAPISVEPQPYFASVNRAIEALAKLGAPIAITDVQQIAALRHQNDRAAIAAAEAILNRYTLVRLHIDRDGFATGSAGGAQPTLVEQGWRVFLLRVANEQGSTEELTHTLGQFFSYPSRVAAAGGARSNLNDTVNEAPRFARDWLTSLLYNAPPMSAKLSGLGIEYMVIQLYSRDRGHHSAQLNFFTSSYPQTYEYRNRSSAKLDFNCVPSRDIILRVRDADGRGCVASLTIKDSTDRVYPLQVMRVAPDMYFESQIYRGDGETVRLPDGDYIVECRRGPEYLVVTQNVAVDDAHGQIEMQLKRWIDPSKWGWYSGDTHIHAGGCAHYANPTEGVAPETMIRHVRGEGLSIGEILSWGPSWYYQKHFFRGRAYSPPATLEYPELQVANNTSLRPQATSEDAEGLLRYDVEVSAFPSSHCGHLVLLRLKEMDYPGTTIIEEWPSWNLPILQWAKRQGAVGGYAHCGLGMAVESRDLPNYEIPTFDSGGTQAIVDVTHGVVEFLSGCDTVPLFELNAWYHLLNCGFRLAMLGETDYPCISDERPGVGRSYVRLDHRPVDDLGYEAWIRGMQQGRLYCGDGRSHVLDFRVNGRRSGEGDLALRSAGSVTIEALVAARLDPEPPANIKAIRHPFLNGWHIENARIGETRNVAVELVINGIAVERHTLVADGVPQPITFNAALLRSSWIALRILPSSHTHPVFVHVEGKPILASKRSAQWCRDCVDKLWEAQSPFIRESERPTAAEAFEHARRVYDAIIGECEVA
jgi:hypothetical protein